MSVNDAFGAWYKCTPQQLVHNCLGYVFQWIHNNQKSAVEELPWIHDRVEGCTANGTLESSYAAIGLFCAEIRAKMAQTGAVPVDYDRVLELMLPSLIRFAVGTGYKHPGLTDALMAWLATLGIVPPGVPNEADAPDFGSAEVGMAVQVRNLRSRPERNGQAGIIVGLFPDKGRAGVQFHHDPSLELSVKLDNCIMLQPKTKGKPKAPKLRVCMNPACRVAPGACH